MVSKVGEQHPASLSLPAPRASQISHRQPGSISLSKYQNSQEGFCQKLIQTIKSIALRVIDYLKNFFSCKKTNKEEASSLSSNSERKQEKPLAEKKEVSDPGSSQPLIPEQTKPSASSKENTPSATALEKDGNVPEQKSGALHTGTLKTEGAPPSSATISLPTASSISPPSKLNVSATSAFSSVFSNAGQPDSKEHKKRNDPNVEEPSATIVATASSQQKKEAKTDQTSAGLATAGNAPVAASSLDKPEDLFERDFVARSSLLCKLLQILTHVQENLAIDKHNIQTLFDNSPNKAKKETEIPAPNSLPLSEQFKQFVTIENPRLIQACCFLFEGLGKYAERISKRLTKAVRDAAHGAERDHFLASQNKYRSEMAWCFSRIWTSAEITLAQNNGNIRGEERMQLESISKWAAAFYTKYNVNNEMPPPSSKAIKPSDSKDISQISTASSSDTGAAVPAQKKTIQPQLKSLITDVNNVFSIRQNILHKLLCILWHYKQNIEVDSANLPKLLEEYLRANFLLGEMQSSEHQQFLQKFSLFALSEKKLVATIASIFDQHCAQAARISEALDSLTHEAPTEEERLSVQKVKKHLHGTLNFHFSNLNLNLQTVLEKTTNTLTRSEWEQLDKLKTAAGTFYSKYYNIAITTIPGHPSALQDIQNRFVVEAKPYETLARDILSILIRKKTNYKVYDNGFQHLRMEHYKALGKPCPNLFPDRLTLFHPIDTTKISSLIELLERAVAYLNASAEGNLSLDYKKLIELAESQPAREKLKAAQIQFYDEMAQIFADLLPKVRNTLDLIQGHLTEGEIAQLNHIRNYIDSLKSQYASKGSKPSDVSSQASHTVQEGATTSKPAESKSSVPAAEKFTKKQQDIITRGYEALDSPAIFAEAKEAIDTIADPQKKYEFFIHFTSSVMAILKMELCRERTYSNNTDRMFQASDVGNLAIGVLQQCINLSNETIRKVPGNHLSQMQGFSLMNPIWYIHNKVYYFYTKEVFPNFKANAWFDGLRPTLNSQVFSMESYREKHFFDVFEQNLKDFAPTKAT